MIESAITIGKFDGFHRGHQLLLDDIHRYAEEHELESVCCKLIGKGSNIMSTDEEAEFTSEMGIDRLEYMEFTPEFACMTPEQFVKEILIDRLNVRYIAVGTDFRFGKNREGDISTLRELGEKYGFKLNAIEKLRLGDDVVSSTRVRAEMSKGNMREVSELLGRAYSMTGIVLDGKKLGRTLGFPTINLEIDNTRLLPKYGVYATIVEICNSDGVQSYKGITNVGVRPSVDDGDKPTVETFIYDFNQDIYGAKVVVSLIAFVRPEMKFNGLDELTAQINKDIEVAKTLNI